MNHHHDEESQSGDIARMVFHFFNIVNWTLGVITFGVAASITASPLPLEPPLELSMIYGGLLICAVIVVAQGFIGIYGCVHKKRECLKLYGVITVLVMGLEIAIGCFSTINNHLILQSVSTSVSRFKNISDHQTFINDPPVIINGSISESERWEAYKSNLTYRVYVNKVHKAMRCCSFVKHQPESCFTSNFTRVMGTSYSDCVSVFDDFISRRIVAIRIMVFLLVPLQIICLICAVFFIRANRKGIVRRDSGSEDIQMPEIRVCMEGDHLRGLLQGVDLNSDTCPEIMN